MDSPEKEFCNSPLIFVKEPCLYTCVVTHEACSIQSQVFNVQMRCKQIDDVGEDVECEPVKPYVNPYAVLRIPPPQCELNM